MPSRARTGTVREYAEGLLRRVAFVDIYGREVGLDYPCIRKLVLERFPKSKMSGQGGNYSKHGFNQNALRHIKCQMVFRGDRLPKRPWVRGSARWALARDYTRALVLQQDKHGIGLSDQAIRRRVRKMYPEVEPASIAHVRAHMVRGGFTLPTGWPPFKAVENG